MAIPEVSNRLEEARKQSKTDPSASEATFKDVLSKGPGTSDAAGRDFEAALTGLGEIYRDQRRAEDLSQLVQSTRSELSNLPKAKTAKIGKSSLKWSMVVVKACVSEHRPVQKSHNESRHNEHQSS